MRSSDADYVLTGVVTSLSRALTILSQENGMSNGVLEPEPSFILAPAELTDSPVLAEARQLATNASEKMNTFRHRVGRNCKQLVPDMTKYKVAHAWAQNQLRLATRPLGELAVEFEIEAAWRFEKWQREPGQLFVDDDGKDNIINAYLYAPRVIRAFGIDFRPVSLDIRSNYRRGAHDKRHGFGDLRPGCAMMVGYNEEKGTLVHGYGFVSIACHRDAFVVQCKYRGSV